ncbi:MAG: hypothetical protein WCK54_19525 [Desulfuromonadales bacterium]
MIGYSITRKELETLIEAEKPGWLKKAAIRTAEFRKNGKYEEKSNIWSEIKPAYMRLQGDCKCSYCERKLESIDYGKGEQDVEHFRPKSSVREWKMPKNLADQGIKATTVPGTGGYFLLPYNLFNYSASCKPCNSVLKSDYFPIAGTYDLSGDEPETLQKEKPYLIYPIGDFDCKPEDLIKFHGVSPQAAVKTGHDRARALVTIEFFELDDEACRKNLFRERAMIICTLFPQMVNFTGSSSATAKKTAQNIIDGFTSPRSPHTNCARCFKQLFKTDPVEAEALFERAGEFIASVS